MDTEGRSNHKKEVHVAAPVAATRRHQNRDLRRTLAENTTCNKIMPNWAKWKNFIRMDDAISMEQVITPTMEFASFASIFSDRPTPPNKRQDSSIPAVTKPSIKETRSNTIAPGSVKTVRLTPIAPRACCCRQARGGDHSRQHPQIRLSELNARSLGIRLRNLNEAATLFVYGTAENRLHSVRRTGIRPVLAAVY